LFSTLLGVARTRLELLANELEEERQHLTRLLVYVSLSLFFFGLGVIALSMLAVAAFWDTHRLAAIAIVALLHLCVALYCGMTARHLAAHKPKLFSATLAEIDKDCVALSSIDE
jgi:uncharacterized membrane protein YqjE